MISVRLLLLIFVVGICLSSTAYGQKRSGTSGSSSDSSHTASTTVKLQREVEFQPFITGPYRRKMSGLDKDAFVASLDLGEVPAGAKLQLQLKLGNNMSEPIKIEKARSENTFGEFEISPGELAVGQHRMATFTLETGFSSDVQGRSGVDISFHGAESPQQGQLRITWQVTSLLEFGSMIRSASVTEGLVEYRMHVRHTPPITAKNLKVEVPDDAFEGMEITTDVEPIDEFNSIVRVTGSASDLGQGTYVKGNVIVSDRVSGKSADTVLIFHRQAPIEVLPRILTFVETEEGVYEAAAIVRLAEISEEVQGDLAALHLSHEDQPQTERENQRKKPPVLRIDLTDQTGTVLNFERKNVNDKFARVKVVVAAKSLDSVQAVIWTLRHGETRLDVRSEVQK